MPPEDQINRERLLLEAPLGIRRRGKDSRLVFGAIHTAPDPKLVRTIALTHSWLEEIKSGILMKDIAKRYGGGRCLWSGNAFSWRFFNQ
jgi:site-specific DNA recombinase